MKRLFYFTKTQFRLSIQILPSHIGNVYKKYEKKLELDDNDLIMTGYIERYRYRLEWQVLQSDMKEVY